MKRTTDVARWLAILALALTGAFFVAGCGGDDDPSQQTGEGATAGATGEEAGGFAVEAGKQRDPKDVQEEEKNFSKEPPPIQISSGNNSGYRVDEPTAVIVRSNKDLKEMRSTLFSRGVKKEDWVGTDFKTRQYVGVFMPESSKGSLIAITDIYQGDDKIVIKVTELLNGKGCETSGDKPRPWQVVETRAMEGQPVIELKKQRASPC